MAEVIGFETFKCNSNVAPGLDITAALGSVVATGLYWAGSALCGEGDFDGSRHRRCDEQRRTATFTLLGSGSVFMASAVYGFVANGQCRTKLTKRRDEYLKLTPHEREAREREAEAREREVEAHEREAEHAARHPVELRVDPECLRQRGQRLRRAQEIADLEQRTKALLAIPTCEAVPVQRQAPAEAVPSRVLNTEPVPPPVKPPSDDQPAPPATPEATP